MRVRIEVSAGELVDRITILEIKAEMLGEDSARSAVKSELLRAYDSRDRAILPSARLLELTAELWRINRLLWDMEESIRGCERASEFGERFVELARRIYTANDRRAALKRRIDECVGSEIFEHKSFELPEI